ncbi:Imm71 family immunity protein [Burkholderia sp. BCC1988]|uniref:Imm71 family immunity protein n=1 Tax=Burkholderia sp. BCC1988 TaxID=2817443 RepID=UPI002AAFD732|nr:Imm71 family immunity protein [Burkholderia sp. BCC1988]
MMNTPSSYDMTDDTTRRRMFWLLRRLTSLALWKAKCDAFKIFADAYQVAIKTWPANDPEVMEADRLRTIFEILSDYDTGVAELGKRRRFVWCAGQAAPYPPKVDALHQLTRASQFHSGKQVTRCR